MIGSPNIGVSANRLATSFSKLMQSTMEHDHRTHSTRASHHLSNAAANTSALALSGRSS